jgi:heme exporter protein A
MCDIDGRNRRRGPELRARFVAYLGHLPGIEGRTCRRWRTWNSCAACMAAARRQTAREAALAIVGLAGYEDAPGAARSRPARRSGSTLARLWLSPAPLWLLDEPYANLDLDGINLVNRMVSGAPARRRGGPWSPPTAPMPRRRCARACWHSARGRRQDAAA